MEYDNKDVLASVPTYFDRLLSLEGSPITEKMLEKAERNYQLYKQDPYTVKILKQGPKSNEIYPNLTPSFTSVYRFDYNEKISTSSQKSESHGVKIAFLDVFNGSRGYANLFSADQELTKYLINIFLV